MADVHVRHRLVVVELLSGHARKPVEMVNWIQAGIGDDVSGRVSLNAFAQALADAEAAGLASAQAAELAERKWIPVGERMPNNEQVVLVFGHYDGDLADWDFQAVCAFEKPNGLWRGIPSGAASDEVTHWMPLPEPPKASET